MLKCLIFHIKCQWGFEENKENKLFVKNYKIVGLFMFTSQHESKKWSKNNLKWNYNLYLY
jgi:hypothetical protein